MTEAILRELTRRSAAGGVGVWSDESGGELALALAAQARELNLLLSPGTAAGAAAAQARPLSFGLSAHASPVSAAPPVALGSFDVLLVHGARCSPGAYLGWMSPARFSGYRILAVGELTLLLLWREATLHAAAGASGEDTAQLASRWSLLLSSLSSSPSCARGRAYSVLAINDVVTYSFYAPIVAAVWYHQLGWHTQIHQIGDQRCNRAGEGEEGEGGASAGASQSSESALAAAFCGVVESELSRHVSSGFAHIWRSGSTAPYDTIPVAQLSRAFAAFHPRFYPEDFLLTADSDILPTDGEYFLKPLRQQAAAAPPGVRLQSRVQIYQSGCCGTFRFTDRTIDETIIEPRGRPEGAREIQRVAMSYIGAHVYDWRELLSHSFHAERGRSGVLAATQHAIDLETDEYYSKQDRRRLVKLLPTPGAQGHYMNRAGRFWALDELIVSRLLQEWEGWPTRVHHIRSPQRIDKEDFRDGRPAAMPLEGDSHLVNPGYLPHQWTQVAMLIRRLVPEEEFRKIEAYVERIQKVVQQHQ
jgi:hypothetical protein